MGKVVHKIFDIRNKFTDNIIKWIFWNIGHFWEVCRKLVSAIIISNCISCYLINPTLKFVRFSQTANMSMYLEKDILQFSRVGTPLGEENPGCASSYCV